MNARSALLASIALCGAFAMAAEARDAPQRIGEPRPIEGLQSAADVNQRLRWVALPNGGHAAALRISSPGAAALRVALRVGELPRETILRFYAPGESASRHVLAAQVMDALQRNARAGESGPDARTWWSPVVAGDAVVVEIELAPGADPSGIAIALPMVSHIATWQGGAGAGAGSFAIVTHGGASYACPGTLVAPRDARVLGTYFATRAACIGSQADAATLQAIWPARASGVGARLLYASGETDTALVVLDEPPADLRGIAPDEALAADPALEQWVGARAASAAAPGTFSSP